MAARPLPARLYSALEPRRALVLALAGALVAACAALLAGADLREDIATMLPDGRAEVAEDFRLLGGAPFTRRLTITVSAPDGGAPAAARTLAVALAPPHFTDVVFGPPSGLSPGVLAGAVDLLPSLATPGDLAALDARLSGPDLDAALGAALQTLLSPQGPVLEAAVRRDPLALRELVLAKFGAAVPSSSVRVRDGVFVSGDGGKALILASSGLPMTDAGGARELLAAFDAAVRSALPPGATATLVGGHRHTAANAAAVKRDLKLVLPLSLAALGVILLYCVRSRGVVAALAVPAAAFCVAGGGLVLLGGGVSGIVLGFGGVLLGICVDFALHVLFALRRAGRDTGTALATVAQPMGFGALTSCVALASLLLSDVPGIRQLAWFSIIGLVAALALSLAVLPLLLPRTSTLAAPVRGPVAAPRGAVVRVVLWLALLALFAGLGSQVRFDGDLRSLSYVPEALRRDEAATRRTWGGMTDAAVVFARGADLDGALEANDAAWDILAAGAPDARVTSLAPLLPAPERQRENRARWAAFWDARRSGLRPEFESRAAALGFSEAAFEPFWKGLDAPATPVTPASLEALGAGFLTDLLLRIGDAAPTAMTLVPDTEAVAALFPPNVETSKGLRLVSGSRFRAALERAMTTDVLRFGCVSFAAVVLLVLLLFRDPRRTCAALAPVLSGLAAVAAALWAAGGMNLFHVISVPLVIGLGADYGIFMTNRMTEPLDLDTGRAVAASGLTTLAGLGTLTLAEHPALHSIGVTVLAGIGAAMLTALLVTPVLARSGDPR